MEEALDLSFDRLLMMMMMMSHEITSQATLYWTECIMDVNGQLKVFIT